ILSHASSISLQFQTCNKIARATKREGFLFGPRAEASRDVATGTDIYLIPLAFERQPEKKEASHEGHGSQDHIRRRDGARVDRRRYACLRASFSRPGKERGLSERRLRHSALELLSGDPPPRFCGARLCLRSVL